MEIYLTSRFRREAKRLPRSLRATTEERVALFAKDPFDPALRTHKLTGHLEGCWSFSIDFHIRIIFEFDGKRRAVFHSIGDHSIYD